MLVESFIANSTTNKCQLSEYYKCAIVVTICSNFEKRRQNISAKNAIYNSLAAADDHQITD